jgi:TRAP-type C4-dicarboxylate transport system permease small subunit
VSAARLLALVPRVVVGLLLAVAIGNLLVGVFLRYVMLEVTDWLDLDPIRFTWVEEVGEFTLAWLTLLGAAIGVRERAHFTLHMLRFRPAVGRWLDRLHHGLIAGFGLIAAWYGFKLCLLNLEVRSAGLQLNLATLYAAAVAGGLLMAAYAVSMIVRPSPRTDLLIQ